MRKSEQQGDSPNRNTGITQQPGDSELASLESSTIMMVDDEPTTLDVIEMFLVAEGYRRFLKCTDARQVIGQIRTEKPDLLLLNLLMPELDGLVILDRMQADPEMRGIPVVMVTSSTDAKTKQRALEHGATEFLHKPVDPSELVLRVRNTLSAKILRDSGGAQDPPQRPVPESTLGTPAAARGAERLVSNLDGRGARSRAIIATFVERLHEKLHEMETCFAAGDHAELVNLAHWLKGAAGTVGFDAFTEPAAELGTLAANRKKSEIEDAIRALWALADRIEISGEGDG